MPMDCRLPILLALAVGIHGGPTRLTSLQQTTSCSKECTDSNKFKLNVGSTYQYNYEAETRTSLQGASSPASVIGLTAKVLVHVESKCELILKVKDSSLTASDSQTYQSPEQKALFTRALERFPMRLSHQDGVVSAVCPTDADPTWVVNVKKGILSALQNSMQDLGMGTNTTESDVTGRCETEYSLIQQGWSSRTLRKVKDLTTCTNRQGFTSAIQTAPFQAAEGMKSVPLVKSSQSCDQDVSSQGVITRALCHEVHTFRPFSSETGGATTEVSQKLTFSKELKAHRDSSFYSADAGEPQELYYKHEADTSVSDRSSRDALDVINKLCGRELTEVSNETSQQFGELVNVLRKMDLPNLRQVYQEVLRDSICTKNVERVRKFALDAFIMVGTDAGVELMSMLVSSGELKGMMAAAWLSALAFINNPTTQMIFHAQSLLRVPGMETRALVPVSALVASYCHRNPSCGDQLEVADFIDSLQRNLEQGQCKTDEQNFRKVMLSLRALGNLGHIKPLVSVLKTCLSNADNPVDIRVAAIQAFRRIDCGEDMSSLIGVFRDTSVDSELRINAYLAVVRCPSPDALSQIRQVLETETVNQVGSFVWSHLTNLLESSDPENRYIQQLLGDGVLKPEFDLHKLKFSRNYEGSFYVNQWNAGARVDSNLLWSSNSFVPRSASLNLTTTLFGAPLNLLELGGRVEGLETLLETYLGPGKSANDIPDPDPSHASLSRKKIKDIRSQAQKKQNQLRGAFFMRMFGNELSYNMYGANNGVEEDTMQADVLKIIDKLAKNKMQDFSITKNTMFIDSSYTIPTVIGLPLRLTVNGSTTVALNVDGTVDIKDPKSGVLIEGNFEPSGSVVLESSMTVDAMVTRGGLQMVSTLFTSMGAKGRIQLTGSDVFDLSFDITKEKNEIITASSKLFMVYDGVQKKMDMAASKANDKSYCTGEQVTQWTGVQFCASLSLPDNQGRSEIPSFPLNGPAEFSLVMNKRDLPNGYKLEAKSIKTPDMTLLRLMSDTPGSVQSRAVGVDVTLNKAANSLEANLISPWKQAVLTGQMLNSGTVKGIVGKLDVDNGARVYTMDAKIHVERKGKSATYRPTVNLTIPDWKNLQIVGSVTYKDMESVDSDLQITGATESPINVTAQLMNADKQKGVKLTLNADKGIGYQFEAMTNLDIEVKKIRSRHAFKPRVYVRTPTDELVEFNADIEYILDKSLKIQSRLEKITKIPFIFSMNMTQAYITAKKSSSYEVVATLNGPKLKNRLALKYDNRANKNVNTKVVLQYEIMKKEWSDTISVDGRLINNVMKNKQIIKGSSSLNFKQRPEWNSVTTLTYAMDPQKLNLDANMKYGVNLKAKNTKDQVQVSVASTFRKRGVDTMTNYTAKLEMPSQNISIMVKGGQVHSDKQVESDVTITYHPKKTVGFGVRYHNQSARYAFYSGGLTITLPEERQMMFAGEFGRKEENRYISNLEFEVIKGRRTKINTILKVATNQMYEVELGLSLPDLEPVRVIGAYNQRDKGYSGEAFFKKGDKTYRILGEVKHEVSKVTSVMLDVTVPTRRVKFITAMEKLDSEHHYLLDVQWNVDVNMDERFLTNITYDVKSVDDFEISTTLHYPSRTIDFTIKHNTADRYITNIELAWSPEEKIKFYIIFRNDVYNGADRRELDVGFESPFKQYEELSLSISAISNDKQVQTKSKVVWGSKQKVLVSMTVKLPLTKQTADIVGTVTTPFDGFETMTLNLKHRMSDRLESSASAEWGRKRFSINTRGNVIINPLSRRFNGSLEIRTPFETLRVLTVRGLHQDDNKKFRSSFKIEIQNSTGLSTVDIGMDADHSYSKVLGLMNKGTFTVTAPGENITTVWEVSQLSGSTKALLDIQPMRGNRFKLEIGETHSLLLTGNKISSKFELLIPTENLRQFVVTFNHEDRPGFVSTVGGVTKDNLEIMAANVKFQKSATYLGLDVLITSIYSENLIFKVSSVHSIMPYRANLELSWGETPYKILADSNVFFNDFGLHDYKITITTPIQGARSIVLTEKRQRNGLKWETNTKITVDQQSVTCSVLYRYDHEKFTQISLSSSFPQFPGLTAVMRLDGMETNFNGDASFQMAPYVGKISTDFKWLYYEGSRISGSVNLNTPFPTYPYMKSKFDSDVMGVSRVSTLEVEYLPTQVIKAILDHRFTSLETLEGTLKVTSPFTENKEVVAGFTHVGTMKDFKTNAKITCDCITRPVFTEAIFSLKNGVISKFVMESPFRGYETVNWTLNHQNSDTGYHTRAKYETSGSSISFENLLKHSTSGIDWQVTFLTPFADINRTHVLLSHKGMFPNTKSHAEVAYNEKMIKTDFDLTHNDKASIVNAVVATPFNRYENVRTTITKTGSLDDFTATVEVLYSLNWTASLKHKYSANEIHTAALLKAPYLPDTVSLGFNYTGKLTDFSANIDYILNPNYRTLSEAKFKYNFPEVYLLSKMTTAIEKDVRVNEVLLRHTQDFKTNEVAKVSSQFLANIREKKVNVDFNMNYNGKNSAIALWSFNTNLTVETPQPDFAKSVLVYSLVSESDFKQQQHLVFETPMLEKLTMIDSNTFDEQTITRSQKWMYGGDLFSQEQFWQKGRYTYSITTPFKGYEETRMELRYSEFNDWMNKQPISADLSFTSSNLSAPVKMAANAVIDAPNGAFNALNFSAVTTYAKDQKHTFDLAYKPGYANSKMTSTKQGYELSSAELSYSLEKVNGIIKSSMLSAPVEYSGITKLRTWKDFVITHKFTSPFEYVKHAEFQVQNQVVSGENKPGVLLKYIGAGKKDQVFSVKPSWTWKVRDAGNMKMSTALSMESPFEQFNNLDISWGHEHAIAPLRIKESALVKFNDKKYLDLETEFGALNKILGVIAVHAPRQMEFSFTGVNEGESVNGDLNLNWDKQNSNSNFRMQFGLADSGTKNSIKKDFSIRFTHPGRIVSLRNGYENSDGKISSLGNIFWDEEKRQGVSYDASYTKLVIRGVETHSSTVTVTLPTRKIEVSGSSTSKGSKQVASAKVYWDANNDPLKVVEVNFEMNPTDVKKAALITLKLPSKNKEVSLSTELAVNDGVRLLDGETRFTYSPDADKTVGMKYTIQQTDSSYRSSWSVDHVATDTHMKMTSDLSSSDTVTKGDLSVLYNSQQANTLAFNLQGQLNMEQKSASLQVGSSVEKASISAKLSTESPYMVTVETARNTVPTWRSVWRVDTAARSLDVSVTYDNMKGQVVTKAFFPNETRLVSETSTSRDAASTQQARLVSELNDRHLHAKMSWRKDLFSDIANYGSSTVKGAVSEMSPVMRQSFNTLSNTLQDKQKAIASSMREELSPIIDTYKEEIKVLEREVSKMRQELRRMYNNNDLYMKDVEKWFLAAAARAIEANNAFVIRMETVYQQGRAVLDRAYNELNSYPYLEKYRTLARTAENSLKEANEVLIKELNLAIQKVMEGLNKIAGVYDEMITNISQELIQLLQALVKEFTLAPFMADIEAAIVRLQADLRLSEAAKANMTRALEQLQQMLNEVLNTNDLMESFEAFSEGSQRILREHFGNLADNKDVQDIKKALQLMYQQVLKIHQFLEKNLSAKDMVETVLQMLRDQVLSDFKQLPLGLLDLPKSRVTTFDLVNGNVEFDLYLPIPMENFEDAMKFTMSGYLSKLQGLADKYFPRGDFCLWDLYYRLPPVRWSAQKDWIPPFDAVGTISGKQHIMTFDGRHYDLAGLCSYMLAADLVNNTFSVILRYDGNQKDLKPQSIVVMVDGRTIEISSSYLMKVDGKPAEMPYTADGLSILRRGQWVTLDSAQGVKVVSYFSNQYHMVHLSGWYFGKVGGLFGNFDNEHYNDWTKPDGSLETQDRKLLNSWEVAGTCRPQMQRVVIDDDAKTRNDQCTEVFDSSLSNLRPCFLMVSPNPYRQNCDVSPGDVCKQAALYREICAGQNIDVDLPPQCVKCAASGDASGTVKYGAGGDQPAPVTMDTVFIVEEAPCNKNIQDKLKDIVITLDQKSVDAGKQENRYSLVGYYDGTPTTYTIEGQLFNQAVKFAKGVENLRFNGVQGRTSDLLSVLQHVTSLPYRPGVKKTVVLVSCTPCDIYKDFSYHQLRTLLRQQDISLHVLRDSGFNLQTNRAPQNHIFGMDNEKLFAGQSVEPDLYQDMEKPSDYCASLALESRGAVFDSSNLHAGSVKHQRDFIGQFGVRLQQQNEPVCQVCNCELDSTGSPVTVCRRCDSQPINFQPPTTMIKKLTEYKNALTQNIQALLY